MSDDPFVDLVDAAVEEADERRRHALWEQALGVADQPLRRALALVQLGALEVALGDVARGQERFDEAREAAPSAPFVYRGASEALQAAGETEAAEEWQRAGVQTLVEEAREHGASVTVPWHPPDLWDEVVAAGGLSSDLKAPTHAEYSRRVDRIARALIGQGMTIVGVRPIGTHDETVGELIPWPPARNEPCWCGSGQKYKRCCGGR